MNRRNLLQALSIAPVVALAPKEAQAAQETSWNERKLFTISGTLEGVDDQKLLKAWALDWEPPACIANIVEVIRASTRTPDIMEKATVTIWGNSSSGETRHLTWGEQRVDTAALFRDGGLVLAQLIRCAARDVIEKRERPRDRLAFVTMLKDGALQEQLKQLGGLKVSFFYYGPTPYPQDGRIYTFNHESKSWEPRSPKR